MFALVGSMMFGSAALADTTIVGAEDNTSTFWTAFSDYYTLAPNKTLKLKFTNYTDKAENWHNWAAVVTTDAERGADGYSEYVVLRADNYAWQYALNTGPDSSHDWFTSLTSNYNWSTFKDDLDASTVEMTIERKKAVVTIHADITTSSSATYYEEFVINCGDGNQNIRAFLTTELGHLVIDNDATAITDTEIPAEPTVEGLVGLEDNTTAWWTAFSDYYKIPAGKTLKIEFTNYSDKIENYHNWILVATTDAARNGDGYYEYFVLRSDNYAWGDGKNTWNDPSNANFWGEENFTLASNFNWDTFKNDMDGANVLLEVSNDKDNNQIVAKATITPAGDGATPYEMTFVKKQANFTPAVAENISAFLTIEGGHLIIKSAELIDKVTISSYGWSTFSSDYALDFAKATEGLEAYMITGHEGNVVTLAKVTGTVPAGTGLLLKGNAGAEYNIPIVGSSATDVLANLLKAGTGAAVSAESGKTTYVLGVKGGHAEFQKITATKATVEKGKAYLVFNETITAPAMVFDGAITGISAIESAGIAEDGIYYNLSGQRVAQPTKGLYIVNGKKMIVKK